jgi:hypothetical protein
MSFIRVFIGVLLIGLYSCSSKQDVVVGEVADNQAKIDKLNQYIMALSNKVDSLEKIIEENQRKTLLIEHDSLLFTMQRTPCLGTCPVYKLEVYTDGYVKYNGRNYVDLMGVYTGYLKPEQINKVNQLFIDADFYSFKDQYVDYRLDIPATIIEYNSVNGYKKVEASTEIPRNFRVLVSELELLIEEIDWTLTDY